jgi:hypothetical protein
MAQVTIHGRTSGGRRFGAGRTAWRVPLVLVVVAWLAHTLAAVDPEHKPPLDPKIKEWADGNHRSHSLYDAKIQTLRSLQLGFGICSVIELIIFRPPRLTGFPLEAKHWIQ